MNWTIPNFQPIDGVRQFAAFVATFFPQSTTEQPAAQHSYVCDRNDRARQEQIAPELPFQDIIAGRGCGVIDPHTDLVQDLLAQLDASGWFRNPENRRRMVYLEPSRQEGCLPFNVLTTTYVCRM